MPRSSRFETVAGDLKVMSSITTHFNIPANPADFERLCRSLFARLWGIPETQLHGRPGQRQSGVDFYCQDEKGKVRGGQSKLHDPLSNVTREDVAAELLAEVEKAMDFTPRLHSFTFATSFRRDVDLQKLARELTEKHAETGLFSVHVYGWDDIEDLLQEFPEIADRLGCGMSPLNVERLLESVDSLNRGMTSLLDIHGLSPRIPATDTLTGNDARESNHLRDVFIFIGRMALHSRNADANRWMADLLSADLQGRAKAALDAATILTRENMSSELGKILADVLERQGTLQIAYALEPFIPERTLALREVAVWVVRKQLEQTEGNSR